ncbi:hypothetical protein JXX19_01110 [Ruthenibacterium lactatiformans]|nr:hypothetical protein [Ruthenibacterium lactatiformans]MBN3025017.1 hypothetical protein [Ruthenibacterium lactatiformans]
MTIKSFVKKWNGWGIQKQNRNKVWARIGVYLSVTPVEMETLIRGNCDENREIMARLFLDGRVALEGDSYIPAVSIDDYNKAYGTAYESDDYDLNTDQSLPHSHQLTIKF